MPRKPSPTPEENIVSAIALAKAILASDAHQNHKEEFLGYCIWKVSEAADKFTVPYWSEGVHALVRQHGSLKPLLKQKPLIIRHEHVNTRQSLIDRIMHDPTSIERVLRDDVIACLVTTDEHARLSNKLVGFERYIAAGIRVWDVQHQRWMDDMEGKR